MTHAAMLVAAGGYTLATGAVLRRTRLPRRAVA